MKNIGLFFGGNSVESDISILTALDVSKGVDASKYNLFLVYITKQGKCYCGDALKDIKIYSCDISKNKNIKEVTFIFGDKCIYEIKNKSKLKKLVEIDAVLNCCHGHNGEDGAIQGMLQISGVASSSSNIFASSISMDKDMSKRFLQIMGAKVLPHILLKKGEVLKGELVEFPVVVKPSALGSSIGVSFCGNMDQLLNAVESAFEYDNKVLIEKGLVDFTEINCACARIDGKVTVSNLEFPKKKRDILTFADKYVASGDASFLRHNKTEMEKMLDQKVADEIKNTTKKIYEFFEFDGVVRVDFMLCDGELFVNEINSIPGSLAYFMFDMKKAVFISALIENAINLKEKRQRTIKSFESSVLTNIKTGKIRLQK